MQQNELINLNICLSDIPEASRLRANNNKVYANFTLAMRREPDKHGNNINVWMNQTKEERGNDKVYVGSGKLVVFEKTAAAPKTNPKKKSNLDF